MVTSTTVVRSTATLERVQDRIRGTGIMLIVVRKSQESLKSLLTRVLVRRMISRSAVYRI